MTWDAKRFDAFLARSVMRVARSVLHELSMDGAVLRVRRRTWKDRKPSASCALAVPKPFRW